MFNWLSLITGFFYIVLGVFVVLYKWFIITLSEGVAYGLGLLMVVYGVFRIFRAVYRIRNGE